VTSAPLEDGAVVQVGQTFIVHVVTSLDERALADLPADTAPAHHATLLRADLIAASPLPVIVSGPTGAGKERLARRIHRKSGRRGPLKTLNCATLTDTLLGSELFGHVKGAFSEAKTDRKGLFQAANGGTVFLDEIAELPISQQPALLRVLQERRVRPVGADREAVVDVRIVAATHADLEAECDAGRFRRDLLARLRGAVLRLPALAERPDEICTLFHQFLPGRALSPAVATRLLTWPWPENVRELQHVAAYVEAVAPGESIVRLEHLPDRMQSPLPSATPDTAPLGRKPTTDELIGLLRAHEGNVSHVARQLGLTRVTLYRQIKRAGLNADDYR
jgi:DNA-binding NtrC family response regulator